MSQTADDKLEALVRRVGKVRLWLLVLAILKVAALCLALASAYIGIYAWLDHRLNFGETGRLAALVLLVAGLGLILHRLTKLLLRDVSCSGAANYIEGRISLNQQLVTAMEYYENRQEYPYSRALAEQLVVRVDADCSGLDFGSTVEKWKGYALGAVILFGLATAWFYIRDNYLYFSAYFARLTQPVSAVAPLPNTTLESVTENIVAEPDSEVIFAAAIEGRPPELAKLVLVKLEPDAAADGHTLEPQETQLRPTLDSGRTPRLEVSRSFPEPGRFKYRFETDSAATDWHELNICPAPVVERMTAKVVIPKNPTTGQWVKPYTEQIDDQRLEVIHNSGVSLNVQATDNLKEVRITGLGGETVTKQLNGAKEFNYHFEADRKGAIKFDLVNEKGLSNDDLPGLEVLVKTDEPPQFKLICPEGDYLTTDVASVPVRFEITDDFGLDSARMRVEIPGYRPKELVIPVENGARSKEYHHTIELEEYDLSVGDSILFSAEATDVDTGSAQANRTSSSEVYFIEIRPYRQNWRPKPGGGQGQGGMPPPVELLNILEYTRAIVKKTWAIAAKPYLTESDRAALDSIDNDVRYCAEQLAIIRDDSEYGFTEGHKVVLNAILQHYDRTSRHLSEHNADSALMPAKEAYRLLRKFIVELELQRNPPSSGQAQQPKQPDSVKMQENPEFAQYEKERIEAEIKKVQQELAKLTREQKNLQRTFESLLKQQAQRQSPSQQIADGESPASEASRQQGPGGQSGRQRDEDAVAQTSDGSSGGQGGNGEEASSKGPAESEVQSAGQDSGSQSDSGTGDNQHPAEDQRLSEAEDARSAESASGGRDADGKRATSEIQGDSEGQGGDRGRGESEQSASAQKQSADAGRGDTEGQALGKDSEGLGRDGRAGEQPGQTQGGEQGQYGRQSGAAATEARLRMLQAKQHALQQQVERLKHELQQLPQPAQSEPGQGRSEAQDHLDEAMAKMDEFQDKLAEARYRAQMGKQESEQAVELVDSARREMDLASKALDGELNLTEEEKLAREAQRMAQQLAQDADALDESLTPEEEQDMLARLEAARRMLELMPEPQWATIDQRKAGGSAPAPVYTTGPQVTPAEAARQLARQFWSISIEARKHSQRLGEDEPSDVKFFGQENEFFENAAKFGAESVRE